MKNILKVLNSNVKYIELQTSKENIKDGKEDENNSQVPQ